MADAQAVLRAALDEALRLSAPNGRVSINGQNYAPADRLQSLLSLAREALDAGDGQIADERVRASGLEP